MRIGLSNYTHMSAFSRVIKTHLMYSVKYFFFGKVNPKYLKWKEKSLYVIRELVLFFADDIRQALQLRCLQSNEITARLIPSVLRTPSSDWRTPNEPRNVHLSTVITHPLPALIFQWHEITQIRNNSLGHCNRV